MIRRATVQPTCRATVEVIRRATVQTTCRATVEVIRRAMVIAFENPEPIFHRK